MTARRHVFLSPLTCSDVGDVIQIDATPGWWRVVRIDGPVATVERVSRVGQWVRAVMDRVGGRS